MNHVRLKMNDAKTEFMYFGNPKLVNETSTKSINVNGIEVKRAECVRLLGAWLDTGLTFKHHVKTKAKAASLNLLKLRKIQDYLTRDACKSLVLSLCVSHLDYGNILLLGLPEKTLQILQNVQNMCAKLVLRAGKFSSNTEALRELHWLPISSRIVFKAMCIIYKSLNGNGPNYIKKMLVPAKIMRTGLRSQKHIQENLCVPFTKKKHMQVEHSV